MSSSATEILERRRLLKSLEATESLTADGERPVLGFWDGIFKPDAVSVKSLACDGLSDIANTLLYILFKSYFIGSHPITSELARNQLLRYASSITAIPLWLWLLADRERSGRSYDEFASWMKAGGWQEFLDEYPVLTELLTLSVEGFSEYLAVFQRHLSQHSDERPDIERSKVLNVTTVVGGLSDPHEGQRSVLGVTLPDGCRLAYKPRSCSAENAYAHLLEWIARRDPRLSLPYAASMSADESHGWMQWADPSPSASPVTYYERAGMLQCLLQALGATDAHMGNIVATAEGPVLIDSECLLTASLRPVAAPDHEIQAIIAQAISTSFLPRPDRAAGEPDLSGLMGSGGQITRYSIPVWHEPIPGQLQLSMAAARLLDQKNTPPPLSRFAAGEALIRGYSEMFLFLCEAAPDLLGDNEMLDLLARCRIRVLLRDTRQYTEILSRSIHPRNLRCSTERERAVRSELQGRALPIPDEAAQIILAAEVASLLRLDVPVFYTTGNGHDLWCEGRNLLPDFFAVSGIERAKANLECLRPDSLDLHRQALRLLWLMAS